MLFLLRILGSIVLDCSQHHKTGLTPLPPSRGYEAKPQDIYTPVLYMGPNCTVQCIYLYFTEYVSVLYISVQYSEHI